MVQAQGGDPRVVDDPEGVLPAAPVVRSFAAERTGILAAVDAAALGRASGELGAGRKKKEDPIDPAVGILFLPKVGDRLEAEQELGQVHARSVADAEACIRSIRGAITLSDDPAEPPPLVYGWHG
jgi:thymidine phosphorylase